MTYFKDFPLTYYIFKDDPEAKLIVIDDLIKSFGISEEVQNALGSFEYYHIREGQTAEELAFKLYDDPELHWLIYYMNGISNPNKEWAMDHSTLQSFIVKTYGVDNTESAHHYEDSDGDIVDYDEPGVTIITNREYENNENDRKRKIKVLLPEFAQDFVSELKARLKENE